MSDRPTRTQVIAQLDALELLGGGDGAKSRGLLRYDQDDIKKAQQRVKRQRREIMSETADQIAVVDWCRAMGGDFAKVYSYPSEAVFKMASRNSHQAGAVVGKLKRMGLATGRPDLALDVARRGYHGLRLELKRRELRENGKVVQTKGRVEDHQLESHQTLESDGYCVRVCFGDAEAIRVLEWYLKGSSSTSGETQRA